MFTGPRKFQLARNKIGTMSFEVCLMWKKTQNLHNTQLPVSYFKKTKQLCDLNIIHNFFQS